MAKGTINVSVENIFPLIKKFLYSDHEIFLRELISNGTDATLKLKHLASIGESKSDYGNPIIEIKIDKDNKKLHISRRIFRPIQRCGKRLWYYRSFWSWFLLCIYGSRKSRNHH